MGPDRHPLTQPTFPAPSGNSSAGPFYLIGLGPSSLVKHLGRRPAGHRAPREPACSRVWLLGDVEDVGVAREGAPLVEVLELQAERLV